MSIRTLFFWWLDCGWLIASGSTAIVGGIITLIAYIKGRAE